MRLLSLARDPQVLKTSSIHGRGGGWGGEESVEAKESSWNHPHPLAAKGEE